MPSLTSLAACLSLCYESTTQYKHNTNTNRCTQPCTAPHREREVLHEEAGVVGQGERADDRREVDGLAAEIARADDDADL